MLDGRVQRKSDCACGGTCPRCKKEPDGQAKLTVSTPGDEFEREADAVADQVMRMPEPGSAVSVARVGHSGEKDLQAEEVAGQSPHVGPEAQAQIDTLRGGGGQTLASTERDFFEPRFGCNFGEVRVHAGAQAAESARALNARAYTVGRDIVFGEHQYAPNTTGGRLLLAHELTHVVQQNGAGTTLQRQHVADTGFRYSPPAAVKRSVIEIQGIVGTTPDGIYGENTRIAVERYQTKLKTAGLYSDTPDGKWGNNTEAAHVAFGISATAERRGYNCAGFAFKDYAFHGLAATKAIYAKMTKLADCSKPCTAYFHKFWMWEVDIKTINTKTGGSSPTQRDFHTVGGQTDKDGKGPDQVMSKNGQRPVEGPKPPLDWEPKSGPAADGITGLPVADHEWVISGTVQDCFCSEKLP